MRVKFLGQVATSMGGFSKGDVVDISKSALAESWCKSGICEKTDEDTTNDRVIISKKSLEESTEGNNKPVPDGMYICGKCNMMHQVDSKVGRRHQKYNRS